MPDYLNGKIYKIVCNITGLVYIGSTAQALSQRLQGHKRDFKAHLNQNRNYRTSFKVLENRDFNIILIEDCSCEHL